MIVFSVFVLCGGNAIFLAVFCMFIFNFYEQLSHSKNIIKAKLHCNKNVTPSSAFVCERARELSCSQQTAIILIKVNNNARERLGMRDTLIIIIITESLRAEVDELAIK